MNRRDFLSTMSLSATAVLVRAESGSDAVDLRKITGDVLPLGVALRDPVETSYTPQEHELIRRHFSIITPENAMKWPQCQPTEDKYLFEKADNLVKYAANNHQKILGHTLVFNRDNDYPGWLFKDGDQKATRKQVEERLGAHIRKMTDRYKSSLYAWDVVNEAVETKPPYYRETDWYKTFGGDFVPLAFRMVREADPKALMIYNDFGIEKADKRERVLILLEELKKEGLLPDVVGIQGHWELDRVPFEDIEETLLEFNKAGVRTSVTELDIDVISRHLYWDPKTRPEAVAQNPYQDRCPDDVLARQAEQYGRLFKLFVKHADKMERVTFWGLTDRHSWLNGWPWKRVNHALLFDREARPKPAFYAVVDALRPLSKKAL